MSVASNTRNRLIIRKEALLKARRFFDERGLLEVDPLLLSQAASIDAHIDLFYTAPTAHWNRRFLFSSPEYPMKRLLAEGSGDIYFLGHVFRDEPQGRFHSPEFLMAEWYRQDLSFQELIDETIQFAQLFVGSCPIHYLPFRQAFQMSCGFDPCTISFDALLKKAKQLPSLSLLPLETYSLDDLINIFLTEYVEPTFQKNCLTALTHFPSSQAALAQTTLDSDGIRVAERFELFYGSCELANGYHELQDAPEQKKRLIEQQLMRKNLNKDPLVIDERFLSALEQGLPSCCGVAVGVDRLIMLEQKAPSLASIQAISWDLV